jgi:cbb3-type cytochrome oxidase subunit 3
VSPEKSLAIAWMAFVMILFYALIGGVIYMVRKGEKESFSEIVDESEKLFE